MIQIQHLTKRFAAAGATVVALNDINLEIQDGDIYGIIGMSGAGKSTLVRCINMLERPQPERGGPAPYPAGGRRRYGCKVPAGTRT